MPRRKSSDGKDTYRVETITKNKVHDKKRPEKTNKAGTVIEKTKSITILKPKVKKQLNDKENSTKRERRLYDGSISIYNRNKFNLTTTASTTTTPFIYLKPYLTLTIKVMVHLDSILTQRLYSKTNRSRLLANIHTTELLQDVRNIFAASALRVNIVFHLNGVKFLKSSNAVPAEANAIQYLEGYCRWQGNFKSKEHHYSILLTGLDIVHYDEEGRKSKKNSGKLFIYSLQFIKFPTYVWFMLTRPAYMWYRFTCPTYMW